MIKVPPFGPYPPPSGIMIVGEAPGSDETIERRPFVGKSGQELTRMLHESGINREECFITNVCKYQPPGNDIDKWFYTKTLAKTNGASYLAGRFPHKAIIAGLEELEREIEFVRPRVIIALGDTALWALTGESGISKWRGSMMDLNFLGRGNINTKIRVIPTLHPAFILRVWASRAILVHDLTRAKDQAIKFTPIPIYNFLIRPSFFNAVGWLTEVIRRLNSSSDDDGRIRISADIETRNKHIANIGLATSPIDAFSIPIMAKGSPEGYWDLEEEFTIIQLLQEILTHPRAYVVWQNGPYDLQYIPRYWGFLPNNNFDTMIAQGVCWPGVQKALHFLASMYCEYYLYWKDESQEWDPKLGEEQLWIYNAKDCCSTWEVSVVLEELLNTLGLRRAFDQKMRFSHPFLGMMLRGTRYNHQAVPKLKQELSVIRERFVEFFTDLVPDPGTAKSKTASKWFDSPIQTRKLFYEFYGIQPVRHRKTGKPTTDDDALPIIGKREPCLLPITDSLSDYRSLNVFNDNFLSAGIDSDGRVRCTYNGVGTETFRNNSSKDSFGFGLNLQNIPPGGGDNTLPWYEVIKISDPSVRASYPTQPKPKPKSKSKSKPNPKKGATNAIDLNAIFGHLKGK